MKKLFSAIVITSISLAALAIPAKPGPRLVEQPNGDTLTIFAHGNQHLHWLTNSNGDWLQINEDGFYQITDSICASDRALMLEQSVAYQQLQKKQLQHISKRKVGVPLNIAEHGLVILANFSDNTFTADVEDIKQMVSGENYVRDYSYTYRGTKYNIHSEGSARQYFEDQSHGAYSPEFDVVGPYTMPNTLQYYGQNSSYYGDEPNAYKLIIDACNAADPDVDFSKYDNDGDGEIDFVYVIYAGYGEADGGSSNTIWPHTYYIKDAVGQLVRLDGKYLNTYACGNELSYSTNQHAGIGTFCHEFSHVLGLPDLYATNNATHFTFGEWDILDQGSYNNEGNTPPAYSAYERFFLGWLTPTILNRPVTPVLDNLADSNKAFIITASGESNLNGSDPSPVNFFLLENRQQTGWDAYLPGHGMLITKVKYSYSKWTSNVVNNTSSAMGIDLVEADGRAPANSYGKAKDAFPAGATEYTPYEDYPITDIKEVDGRIIFDFMGGYDWISSLATEQATELDKKGREFTEVKAVFDMSGRLLYEGSDLTELAPGAYIIKVATEEKEGEKTQYKGVKIVIQ